MIPFVILTSPPFVLILCSVFLWKTFQLGHLDVVIREINADQDTGLLVSVSPTFSFLLLLSFNLLKLCVVLCSSFLIVWIVFLLVIDWRVASRPTCNEQTSGPWIKLGIDWSLDASAARYSRYQRGVDLFGSGSIVALIIQSYALKSEKSKNSVTLIEIWVHCSLISQKLSFVRRP